MSFLKFCANTIFTGHHFLNNDMVLVAKENGVIEDLIKKEDAGEDIQVFEGILSPGFVNAHCHLELSFLKDKIVAKTGLPHFVLQVVSNRNEQEEIITEAIKMADEAMYNNGISVVGDICNTTNTIQQKKQSKVYYHSFLEAIGWLPNVAEQRLQQIQNLQQQFKANQLACSIVPHAPYSISENLWRLLTHHFKNNIVSIHNQESLAENELFLNGTGSFIKMYEAMGLSNTSFKPSYKSSLQTVFNNLIDVNNLLLVHNTFINEDDIAFIHQQKVKVFFCLCINANLFIENRLPDYSLWKSISKNICIGTDSLSSNWSLNILEEIKTIVKYQSSISLEEVLSWATINGASALKMHDNLGSLSVNKSPGINWIEGIYINAQGKLSLDPNAKVKKIF